MPLPEPRPAEECRYDLVSLGEVMLRLDPGEGRVRTAAPSAPGRAAGSTTWPAACAAASASAPRS
ncbi:hypothetical protein ACFQX7_17335 [Luedemannella flava]